MQRTEDKFVGWLVVALVGTHLQDVNHLVIGQISAEIDGIALAVGERVVCCDVESAWLLAIEGCELHGRAILVNFTHRFARLAEILVEATCPIRQSQFFVCKLLNISEIREIQLLNLRAVVVAHLNSPIREWLLLVESYSGNEREGTLAAPR